MSFFGVFLRFSKIGCKTRGWNGWNGYAKEFLWNLAGLGGVGGDLRENVEEDDHK